MSTQKDYDKVERLNDQYKNAPRDAKREVAGGLGVKPVGIQKDTTASRAMSHEGNVSKDAGVAQFQKAGMGPK